MSKEKPDRFQAEGKRQEIELETVVISKDDIVLKPSVKGFSFEHSCLTEGHGLNKPNADAIIYACSLLRQGMKQICITAISSDAREVVKESILLQITNASQMIKLKKDPHAAFALIIGGKTCICLGG
ncbi:hypothetical protein V6N12_029656 [Hibiscus sabdariffa]|uniref:Uncharacterized protein n=1 Tax=Hibiscus sabdariffa TaxID=183260 RepID=A0ABR2CZE7_9ROSI